MKHTIKTLMFFLLALPLCAFSLEISDSDIIASNVSDGKVRVLVNLYPYKSSVVDMVGDAEVNILQILRDLVNTKYTNAEVKIVDLQAVTIDSIDEYARPDFTKMKVIAKVLYTKKEVQEAAFEEDLLEINSMLL
jgi:hypothetical protein